jgi:hypothetical protein
LWAIECFIHSLCPKSSLCWTILGHVPLTGTYHSCPLSICPPDPVGDSNFSGKPSTQAPPHLVTCPTHLVSCCACTDRAGASLEASQGGHLSSAPWPPLPPLPPQGWEKGRGRKHRHRLPSSLASVLGERRRSQRNSLHCLSRRVPGGDLSHSDSNQGMTPATHKASRPCSQALL